MMRRLKTNLLPLVLGCSSGSLAGKESASVLSNIFSRIGNRLSRKITRLPDPYLRHSVICTFRPRNVHVTAYLNPSLSCITFLRLFKT